MPSPTQQEGTTSEELFESLEKNKKMLSTGKVGDGCHVIFRVRCLIQKNKYVVSSSF